MHLNHFMTVANSSGLTVMETTAGLADWLFFHRVKHDKNVSGISATKSTVHSLWPSFMNVEKPKFSCVGSFQEI